MCLFGFFSLILKNLKLDDIIIIIIFHLRLKWNGFYVFFSGKSDLTGILCQFGYNLLRMGFVNIALWFVV